MRQDTNLLSPEKASYNAQEIDGFWVEGMMKRAWAAYLDLLIVFDDICKRIGVKWFAEYGTLLGAVRDKGFIPWDDDVDVCMLRTDYDKLCQCIEKELPEGYLFFYPTDKTGDKIRDFSEAFGRLVAGQGINYEKDHLEKFHGCPYAVGIDIFPRNGLPDDPVAREVLLVVSKLLQNTFIKGKDLLDKKEELSEEERTKKEELFKNVDKIEELCKVKFDRSKNLHRQLLMLADNLGRAYSVDECKDLWFMAGRRAVYKKEWFEEPVYFPFEQLMIPCPKGYDEMLTSIYGDYMKKRRGPGSGMGHQYPFYKNYFLEVFPDTESDCRKREDVFAEKMNFKFYEVKELSRQKCTTIAKYYAYFGDGTHYLVRIPDEKYPFLDWGREKSVYKALEHTGIVRMPVLLQAEDGYKILKMVDEAECMEKDDMGQAAEAALLLNELHQVEYSGKTGVSPLDMLQFYENYLRDELVSQRDIMNLYEQMRAVIKRWNSFPKHMGLTHMNFSSRSFFWYSVEEERKIALIDLKYAGEGDTDWDLVSLAADLGYGEQQMFELLVLYYGETLSEEEYTKAFEKMIFGTCIVSFVRGIRYRLLSKLEADLRKKAFESLKYTKKILHLLEDNYLI